MTTETLSELYQTDIPVIQVGNRYVVVGEHLDHSGHLWGTPMTDKLRHVLDNLFSFGGHRRPAG